MLMGSQRAPVCRQAHWYSPIQPARATKSVRVQSRAQADISSTSPQTSSSRGCPLLGPLQDLPPPPLIHIPWYKRFQQLFEPQKLQRLVASEASESNVVQLPKQVAFDQTVIPLTADLVKDVLSGESSGAIKQTELPSFVSLMGKSAVVLTQQPRHSYLRALLQPAFSKEAVSSYLPEIPGCRPPGFNGLQKIRDVGVKAFDSFKLMTFDFILSLTFGRKYSKAEIAALAVTYKRCTSGFLAWPWLDIPFTPFANALAARKSMIEHFEAAQAEARQRMERGEDVPGIIGRLVAAVDDEGHRLSDEDISDDILLLLMAGQDTSSVALTQCLSNLQDHPEVELKLTEEQESVIRRHGTSITPDALKEMVYAEAVVKETLRRNPVVAQLYRTTASDIALAGHKVPKGTSLLCPMNLIAVTDDRWQDETGDLDPLSFNPDRMLREEASKPGAQMPFGHGPRYCLGAALALAEMKVFLALLTGGYDFTADNNTEWTLNVGMVPKNGLPLVLRHKADHK